VAVWPIAPSLEKRGVPEAGAQAQAQAEPCSGAKLLNLELSSSLAGCRTRVVLSDREASSELLCSVASS
jgi:hypothetical protein